jgi:hypothetical protein
MPFLLTRFSYDWREWFVGSTDATGASAWRELGDVDVLGLRFHPHNAFHVYD